MNNRIALILKLKNISATKFADEIDVQRSSISHILSERNKPSLEFIQKILKTYPEISPEWLISGKGGMLKNPDLFALDEEVEIKENVEDEKVFSSTESIPEEVDEEQQPEIKEPDVPTEDISKTVYKKTPISNQHKKIEKILVFYTDNTFKEYFPETEN